MLILTRRVGESILIKEGEINITVLGICGNQVSIGVDAPKEISVHRKEIHDRIQREKYDNDKKTLTLKKELGPEQHTEEAIDNSGNR